MRNKGWIVSGINNHNIVNKMAGAYWYLRQRERRALRRERVFRDRRNPIDMFDDVELVDKFRFSRDQILRITDEIDGLLLPEGERGGVLPALLQVCVTLRFFATGSFQDAVGEMIGVHQSTVSRTVQKVLDAWMQVLHLYIRPPTHDEVQAQKVGFIRKAGFPGVFACIDGTHVRIQRPREHEATYVNRKNFHSLNVQIVCDADLRILDCVAHHAGSAHDARILRESQFFRSMEANPRFVNGLVLGDSGYPVREWLMTPYGNPTTPQEHRYNNAHKTTRVTVERCIGVLERRWHCLHTELRVAPDVASRIVFCCCLLHNKAIRFGMRPPLADDFVDVQIPQRAVNLHNDRAHTNAGKRVRDHIARTHF